jgi:diacylglycerol kinase family enzyme
MRAPVVSSEAEAPRAARHENVLVLVNERAGGVGPADRARLLEMLVTLGVRRVEVAKSGADLFKNARGHDLVIVLGGDGTARDAAKHAPKNAPPLVLLPGGTLNVLPRALYGDLAWPEALTAALERGRVRRLAYGRANGHPFFVAALFGEPARIARAREAARDRDFIRAARTLRHFVKSALTHKMRARPDGGRMHRAEAIGVLCPSFSGSIEGDCLEWARLDANSVLDVLRVGFRSFGDGWRTDPAVDVRVCRRGDIVSLGLIPTTLDGEPRTFVSRVRITFEPKGPRVIALDPETEGN